MEAVNFVFQTDSKEIDLYFRNNPNYLIEYDKEFDQEENYCALYFSSNDLYYPNSAEIFYKQVVKTNKYEWYRTRVKKATKHIFLRDIKKQWYLNGINATLNSIEKLYAFLKEETAGYNTITVGSSAGGYAAVLFGSMLCSETIFTFNGQFSLETLLETSSERIDPLIFREKYNFQINKYFSLNKYISEPSHLYYFYSSRSKCDIVQYVTIKHIGVQVIYFKTGHHGIPFLKSNLSYVINSNQKSLHRLCGTINHPLLFSFKVEGIYKTLLSLNKQILQKFILKRFFL